MTSARCLVSTAVLLACAGTLAAQDRTPMPERQIDSVFARYAHASSPGCAIGVYSDAETLFARGYGSASLEYASPITTATPFLIGSLTKQFTAAAVALLIERGVLRLDDDVRRFIPELPDYGTKITVGDLVRHTSGVRDIWSLYELAGARANDGYTYDDIVRLLARQKHLNFTPGSQFSYSNSGYALLALIIKRATGVTLRTFADTAIFRRLGMRSTHFHDDNTEVIPGRAMGYSPSGDRRWQVDMRATNAVGDAGLMTTIEDLAQWNGNLRSGAVGGPALLALQAARRGAVTPDGRTIYYSFGLFLSEYRGLATMEHNGNEGGYRSALIRFPDAAMTIVTLCNAGDADPTMFAHRVADVVLAGRLSAQTAETATPSTQNAGDATAIASDPSRQWVGTYYSPELDVSYEITLDGTSLTLHRPNRPAVAMRFVSPRVYRARSMTLEFAAAVGTTGQQRLMVSGGGILGLEFDRKR
ncbi:MAG: serine hydrolase domain-containing protein [bacterium]